MATFGRKKVPTLKDYLCKPQLYIDFGKHKEFYLEHERKIQSYIMNFVVEQLETGENFEKYNDIFEIKKHFERELIGEGLKLFRMIQKMYYAKPIGLQRVWWEREKAGFKKEDKRIMESALADLVINGMIEVRETVYPNGLTIESLVPTITIKRVKTSRVETTFAQTEMNRFKNKSPAKDRLVVKKGQLHDAFIREQATEPTEISGGDEPVDN